MSVWLVECFWPGVVVDRAVEAVERARAATLAARRRGRDVVLVGTILIASDETVFCVFQGREEDVRAVALKARLPFERILTSLMIAT